MDLTLDATTLSIYQACRRKFLLNNEWKSLKWRPHALFDACLRQAIFKLSSGMPPEDVATDAVAAFMQTAAEPGLEVIGSPFAISQEWCAMLNTIIHSLARLTLLTIKDVPPSKLNSWLEWRPLCHQDDSGQLHRWITVDSWTENDLMRELHSWYVTGELAVLKVPMILHVIIIGRMQKGRRASPWARAWQHPGIPTLRLRFKHFEGWKPVYLSDREVEMDAKEWVDSMWKEGVAQDLVRHVSVSVPQDNICADTTRQIMLEASAMRDLLNDRTSFKALPMARVTCDASHAPCHFQPVCFNSNLVTVEELGLYKPRTARYSLAV